MGVVGDGAVTTGTAWNGRCRMDVIGVATTGSIRTTGAVRDDATTTDGIAAGDAATTGVITPVNAIAGTDAP